MFGSSTKCSCAGTNSLIFLIDKANFLPTDRLRPIRTTWMSLDMNRAVTVCLALSGSRSASAGQIFFSHDRSPRSASLGREFSPRGIFSGRAPPLLGKNKKSREGLELRPLGYTSEGTTWPRLVLVSSYA